MQAHGGVLHHLCSVVTLCISRLVLLYTHALVAVVQTNGNDERKRKISRILYNYRSDNTIARVQQYKQYTLAQSVAHPLRSLCRRRVPLSVYQSCRAF